VELTSAVGVVESVTAEVDSVTVTTGSEVVVGVAVEGGSGVWVAGAIVATDVGAEYPAGGVISSAREQAARDRERRITRMVKRNFMKDPFRIGDCHPNAFKQWGWNAFQTTS
jgi:hypothetical protein